MKLLLALLAALLAALLSGLCAAHPHGGEPRLVYRPESGRLFVDTDRYPTPSVFWDRVTQSIIAEERPGPTVGSFASAVVHSAIFDVWYKVGVPLDDDDATAACGARTIAAAYAASQGLRLVFPSREEPVDAALEIALDGCRHKSTDHVAFIGIRAASVAHKLRNAEVLGPNVPSFPWRSPIEQWRPEHVPIDDPDGKVQEYLTEDWGRRWTFGVAHGASVFVEKPEPLLSESGRVDIDEKKIYLDSGEVIPSDNTKRTFDDVVNPRFIRQAMRVVKSSQELTPRHKFTAELWEQGGGTSYPPGCWMTVAEYVSMKREHSAHADVKMYYALSNALSDAAVTTWFVKRYYNYTRPVRAIRDLGALGLLGKIRFYDVRKRRVVRDRATNFVTFQYPNLDSSPPFPEYTSGHSAFSAAAAAVLKRFTRSDQFGASIRLRAKKSRFEKGVYPKDDVVLTFDTFTDAATDAGVSRIYGGIHFDDGNVRGLRLGRIVGDVAFRKAKAEWLHRRWALTKELRKPGRLRKVKGRGRRRKSKVRVRGSRRAQSYAFS